MWLPSLVPSLHRALPRVLATAAAPPPPSVGFAGGCGCWNCWWAESGPLAGLVEGCCWALWAVYLLPPLLLLPMWAWTLALALEGNGEEGGVGCGGCGIEGPVLLRKRAKALRKPSVLSLSGPFPNEMHPQSTLQRCG